MTFDTAIVNASAMGITISFELTTPATSMDVRVPAQSTPYATAMLTSTPSPDPFQQLFQIVISSLFTGITRAEFEAGIQSFKEVVASLFAGRSVTDVIIERISQSEVRRTAHRTGRRLLATAVEVRYRVVGFSSATQAEEASVTAAASGTQMQAGLMATGQFNNLQSIEVLSIEFGVRDVQELEPVDTTSTVEVDAIESPQQSPQQKPSWYTSPAFIGGTTVGALVFFAVVVAMFVMHRRREHGFGFDSRSEHFNATRKSIVDDETHTNQRGEPYIDSHFLLGDGQQAEVTFPSSVKQGEVLRTDLENVLLDVWDGKTIQLPQRASERRDFLRPVPMDVEATLVHVTTLE
eukprot:3456343-Rhodomonas_salina.1